MSIHDSSNNVGMGNFFTQSRTPLDSKTYFAGNLTFALQQLPVGQRYIGLKFTVRDGINGSMQPTEYIFAGGFQDINCVPYLPEGVAGYDDTAIRGLISGNTASISSISGVLNTHLTDEQAHIAVINAQIVSGFLTHYDERNHWNHGAEMPISDGSTINIKQYIDDNKCEGGHGGANVADLSNQTAPQFGQDVQNGILLTAAKSDHMHALPSLPDDLIREGDERLENARQPLPHEHPEYQHGHPFAPIEHVGDTTHLTSGERDTWNNKQDRLISGINIQISGTTISAVHSHGLVTPTISGFMSSEDKNKLDILENFSHPSGYHVSAEEKIEWAKNYTTTIGGISGAFTLGSNISLSGNTINVANMETPNYVTTISGLSGALTLSGKISITPEGQIQVPDMTFIHGVGELHVTQAEKDAWAINHTTTISGLSGALTLGNNLSITSTGEINVTDMSSPNSVTTIDGISGAFILGNNLTLNDGTLDSTYTNTTYTPGENIIISGDVISVSGNVFAPISHEHTQYALSGHAHDQYALTGHTHDQYLTADQLPAEYQHVTGLLNNSQLNSGIIYKGITVSDEGHITNLISGALTPADIGASPLGHTHGYQPAGNYIEENDYRLTNARNAADVSDWAKINYSGNVPDAIQASRVDHVHGYQPIGDYIEEGDYRLIDKREASDVHPWAKAIEKPTYTYSEVGAAPEIHDHDISEIRNHGHHLELGISGGINGTSTTAARCDHTHNFPAGTFTSPIEDGEFVKTLHTVGGARQGIIFDNVPFSDIFNMIFYDSIIPPHFGAKKLLGLPDILHDTLSYQVTGIDAQIYKGGLNLQSVAITHNGENIPFNNINYTEGFQGTITFTSPKTITDNTPFIITATNIDGTFRSIEVNPGIFNPYKLPDIYDIIFNVNPQEVKQGDSFTISNIEIYFNEGSFKVTNMRIAGGPSLEFNVHPNLSQTFTTNESLEFILIDENERESIPKFIFPNVSFFYEVSFNTDGGILTNNDPLRIPVSNNLLNINNLPTPIKNDYTFDGWLLNSSLVSEENRTITTHTELTAKWVEISFTVTYHLNGAIYENGNNPNWTIDNNNGTIIITGIRPSNNIFSLSNGQGLTKEHFYFDGWYKDNNTFSNKFDEVYVEKNIIVYAKWLPIPFIVELRNTHVTTTIPNWPNDNGNLIRTFNSGVQIELPTITRDGFDFVYWELNSEEYIPGIVLNNLVLVAKWLPIPHTITFEIGHGQTNIIREVLHGEVLDDIPQNPKIIGYTFIKWLNENNEEFDFSTPITKNIILTADFNEVIFTITYDTNGGIPLINLESKKEGTSLEAPTIELTKVATEEFTYEFSHWEYVSGGVVSWPITVMEDINLIAIWNEIEIEPDLWDFNLLHNGGLNIITFENIRLAAIAANIELPITNRELGEMFAGQFDSEEGWTGIKRNLNIYLSSDTETDFFTEPGILIRHRSEGPRRPNDGSYEGILGDFHTTPANNQNPTGIGFRASLPVHMRFKFKKFR